MNRYFDTRYLKKVAVSCAAVLLALVMIVYVLYHVTNGFSPKIATVSAQYKTSRETVSVQSCIFRDEIPVYSSYHGTVDYKVSSGERLGVGGTVAIVYREGDSSVTKKLLEKDRRIALLEASNIGDNVSLTTPRTTDAQIEEYLVRIRFDLASGALGDASSYTDRLLSLLNRRELIVTDKNSYDNEIEALKKERALLAASLTGESETVTTPKSGWFYLESDGNEEIFTSEKALNMSYSDFEAIKEKAAGGAAGNGCIGKLALNEKWYAAMTADVTIMSRLTVGGRCPVDFGGGSEISMMLERCEANGTKALLVFSTNEAPSGFDFVRQQKAEIVLSEYRGLGVPTSAIHYYDGHAGVFVLYGSTVFFRVADIVGEKNGYTFVSTLTEPVTVTETRYDSDNNPTEKTSVKYGALALYDSVITEGTGLYHGKILR